MTSLHPLQLERTARVAATVIDNDGHMWWFRTALKASELGRPSLVGAPRSEPSRIGEVLWLEPYADALLEGIADDAPGPEARYESHEAISLAFVRAMQLLPPRQRAVLILRDVLGHRASETPDILGSTEESVTSALKRARATVKGAFDGGAARPPDPRGVEVRDSPLLGHRAKRDLQRSASHEDVAAFGRRRYHLARATAGLDFAVPRT